MDMFFIRGLGIIRTFFCDERFERNFFWLYLSL